VSSSITDAKEHLMFGNKHTRHGIDDLHQPVATIVFRRIKTLDVFEEIVQMFIVNFGSVSWLLDKTFDNRP